MRIPALNFRTPCLQCWQYARSLWIIETIGYWCLWKLLIFMQKVLVYIRDNDNCYIQRVEYTFNSEEDEEAFDGAPICISFSLLSLFKNICTTSGILVFFHKGIIHYIHNLDSRVRHQRNRSRIIISNISLSWHQFKYHYIRIKYKVWHQASLFQCSKISSYLSSCDINQSIIVPGWHWSLPCCPWPRSFPLLSLQTAPGWKLKKKLCFLFKVGSGAPGNWLDTFAMLTECTDAKFCNTTAQVTKVKKCYKKRTYFYIR